MIQVQSHNNNGLFRTRKYSTTQNHKKKRYGRLFIRRSKIYHSLTNNSVSPSYPNHNNFTINYRPQTTQLRPTHIKRKLFTGAGDEQLTPSLSNEQKHIDFTELEHIFDNAIRNRLPLELYKQKSPTKNLLLTQHENHHTEFIPKSTTLPPDSRIELSNQTILQSAEHNNYNPIRTIKRYKILAAILLVSLSVILGFLSVFIFVK